ncbi:hypothetical protein [Bowmanella dokdonensis]|uniref:Uncharacterized protein n=1 Tax=Bowmanella dokdonensis TaxID=751969 RepID=A0A939DK24_9ALTE|nr:hypothetical protein [Bowmanella dokdonensis]MBN7823928.1 hypothetical protein [Bowmanella dokdonensis]
MKGVNAFEFIHSNRDIQVDGQKLRLSVYYHTHGGWFSDYQTNLRTHLLRFAHSELAAQIRATMHIQADISNLRVTDLFGTNRAYGNASPTSIAALMNSGLNKHGMLSNFQGEGLSHRQTTRLRELMHTRAVNFDDASVTVTDIEKPSTVFD